LADASLFLHRRDSDSGHAIALLTCDQPGCHVLRVSRKTKAVKDEVVRMRIPAADKKALVNAAKAEGLDLSAWLRRLAMREVNLLASQPLARRPADG
jgi:hypothetical protein